MLGLNGSECYLTSQDNYANKVSNVPQTIKEQLEQRKRMLENHLAEVNSALEVIEKNPGFVECYNAINKVR